eukprot:COSAG01_NODE_11429_length_1936_cov_2.562330_1_plen_47_part_10
MDDSNSNTAEAIAHRNMAKTILLMSVSYQCPSIEVVRSVRKGGGGGR